ncbi:MAG TPA: NfeD family protein [Opitutaceae bacterium]|nr:NfeD family protein [Opitutaceae bacterium]
MDAFTAYAICFGAGVVFTLISAISAHVFGGEGDVDGGMDAGGVTAFSPLSPSAIAAFVAAFGGFGMILTRIEATSSPWISVPASVVGGVAVAGLTLLILNTVFSRTQSSSEGRIAALAGTSATVISPIPVDGVGEIAYVQAGSRYSAPARSENGAAIANGATVKITRIVGTQFYVSIS